jgi:ubiquinone/menaquinone biosynthesis C-methylase UbiE
VNVIEKIHENWVRSSRVETLAKNLSDLIPEGAKVLDVGCGDGHLDRLILERNTSVSITGIDSHIREEYFHEGRLSVQKYDGNRFPYEDKSFDVVMFIDVLHHTEDPLVLLEEAKRVSARYVLIKDHFLKGFLAGPTLSFMDWVGNARYGVSLPYNYKSEQTWNQYYEQLGLKEDKLIRDLKLYKGPAGPLFNRSLHFINRLSV